MGQQQEQLGSGPEIVDRSEERNSRGQFSKVSKHSDHVYIESQKRRYNNHQVSMCCFRNKDVLLDIIANEATDKGLISKIYKLLM